MTTRVSFTFDLEDHRSGLDPARRYVDATYKVLDVLERVAVTGTFFIVGNVATANPALVRDIAARGHEIGFHGFDHTPLYLDERTNFARQTTASKRLLEDLTGAALVGYRAPIFSLNASTTWCTEELASLGFAYSSSVVPKRYPRYGFEGAPREPFRWPSGVLELPVPLARIAGVTLPFLGGVYLRYLPLALVLRRAASADHNGLWTYLHPYDCDPGEGWARVERTNLMEALILACNRRGTLSKLERLLKACAAPSLRDRVAAGEFDRVTRLDTAAIDRRLPTAASR